MAMRDWHEASGQGTVELAVVLPVILVVAVIGVNACTFFSECASFDRIARQSVRVYATSLAYGQGVDQAKAQIAQSLECAFCKSNEEVEVAVESAGGDCVRYRMTLVFEATLFGMGLKQEIFGVKLPAMRHEAGLVVDPYNPGVVI